MTERTAKAADKPDEKAGDFGQAEVRARFDEAQEKGYQGLKADPRPNSDYSLESGPNSPGPGDAIRVDVADLPHKGA